MSIPTDPRALFKWAIKNSLFKPAEINGKLTFFRPKTGSIVLYEFMDRTALIVKSADSLGNCLVKDSTDTLKKENIFSGGIAGFIELNE